MSKIYYQILALILAVVFVTACSAAAASPTSTSATVAQQTPTVVANTAMNTQATAATTELPDTPTQTAPMAPTEAAAIETSPNEANLMETNRMNIQIGNTVLTATLANNSSAEALKEELLAGPITINMRDYGSMEKVGQLGMSLPRNDQQITTEAGDIILYQGSALVIYYAPNSWNFTRLGKIDNVTAGELREILGSGNVTITLSLAQE